MDRARLVTALQQNLEAVEARFVECATQGDARYAPGKWTVRQLLAHLADCEFINLWRFGKAVAEPGSLVAPFEENQWSTELCSSQRTVESMQPLFRGSRLALLHWVASLPDEALDRASVHPQKGSMTGWDWAALVIGHTTHHLGQVDAALTGAPWVERPIENSHRFGA